MQGSYSLLHPDAGFAKILLDQEKHTNSARVLILRELLAPALFEWERGDPRTARLPQRG